MAGRPTQSAEDYLERIHELIEEKGYARVVDIAESLHVREASVTSMVQRLDEQGYLHYERYRGLVLTPKGREVACRIQRRHETLARFFSLLGLDTATQRRDIEGIEHHLSPATVDLLADLVGFFEQEPDCLRAFLTSRATRPAAAPESEAEAENEPVIRTGPAPVSEPGADSEPPRPAGSPGPGLPPGSAAGTSPR